MTGLGNSVGTPPEGIRAPVVVVGNFDELAAKGRAVVEGKIVVYNEPWEGYGRTVAYRTNGAVKAAELGAVAALVRSVTPVSLQSPHTGSMRYDDHTPKIPTAAISIEDAELLQRLTHEVGKVEVELHMEARNFPPAPSADVIGEIIGRTLPNEVVVIGGHIDSWDVGQGAHDDGGGVVVSMQAARLLLDLGLRPRRTLRVVLFTNEENGLDGGRAYGAWAARQDATHVAAIEMDAGTEHPVGFGLGIVDGSDEAYQRALARLRQIAVLLKPIGADQVSKGGGGGDVSPLMRSGVPGLGLRTVGEHYFDWHHSDADTVDKVSPEDLRANLAAMAVYAYILADMPERLLD
jgi:Zn-dependent M28 family amino/carboxypeptidase